MSFYVFAFQRWYIYIDIFSSCALISEAFLNSEAFFFNLVSFDVLFAQILPFYAIIVNITAIQVLNFSNDLVDVWKTTNIDIHFLFLF